MSHRFFRHGELPLVLLALLAEHPRHGYDLMAELARRFGPRYRASPGSVYPALEALESEGLIERDRTPGASKTIYRNTEAGGHALEARGELLADLEVRTGVRFGGKDSMGPLLDRFKARLLPLAGRVDSDVVAAVLEQAAFKIEALDNTASGRKK